MKNNQYWTAIILILIGVVLLFYQTDLLDFSTADLISFGFIMVGAIFLLKGLNRTDKKGIFGGVFFSVFGIAMFLMREHILPRNDEFGFAAFFLAMALGNFAYLPFKKDKFSNIVWGIILTIIGVLFLWAHYGYYPSWYIYDQIALYWPVILIVIGAAMIIKGYFRSARTSATGIS